MLRFDFDYCAGNRSWPMDFLLLRLKRYGAFDACLLIGALVLFAINEHAIKPVVSGAELAAGYSFAKLLLLGYFNDFLGGVAFLAYTNLLLALVRPRWMIRRLPVAVVYIFLCGLFWEYVAPLVVPDSVSDPWDVFAYCVGAVAYWGILLGFRHAKRVQRNRGAS